MNKYDKAVIQSVPGSAQIFELTRHEAEGTSGKIIDFMLEGLLSIGKEVKNYSSGAFYLVIKETKSDLVHIAEDLEISSRDITSVVQASARKKSFEHEGFRYKLFRKVK